MKHLTRASTLAMLLLLSCALAVNAAAPAAPEPGQASYLDDQPHTLAAHDSAWYRFEFAVMGPGFLCHFFTCADIQGGHGSARKGFQRQCLFVVHPMTSALDTISQMPEPFPIPAGAAHLPSRRVQVDPRSPPMAGVFP